MRSTVISGLVKVAGEVSPAANEDRMAEGVLAEEHRSIDATEGWDPYDVWRTRVKKARDPKASGQPDKLQPDKKHRD